MKTYLYRASNLSLPSLFWLLFHSGSQFLVPAKNHRFLRFIHTNNIIIIIIFFRRVFSECTETIATSLIPQVTNFPEIWPLIIGFSFTVWTKMRPVPAHFLMV